MKHTPRTYTHACARTLTCTHTCAFACTASPTQMPIAAGTHLQTHVAWKKHFISSWSLTSSLSFDLFVRTAVWWHSLNYWYACSQVSHQRTPLAPLLTAATFACFPASGTQAAPSLPCVGRAPQAASPKKRRARLLIRSCCYTRFAFHFCGILVT
jgi:hypothetical protein